MSCSLLWMSWYKSFLNFNSNDWSCSSLSTTSHTNFSSSASLCISVHCRWMRMSHLKTLNRPLSWSHHYSPFQHLPQPSHHPTVLDVHPHQTFSKEVYSLRAQWPVALTSTIMKCTERRYNSWKTGARTITCLWMSTNQKSWLLTLERTRLDTFYYTSMVAWWREWRVLSLILYVFLLGLDVVDGSHP